MSVASRAPEMVPLRDMCLYPVVQQKLAAGARVDFSDLHFPLNLEASEIIEKFYERFRKEDGSVDRIKVIRAMAGDFNSLLNPRIYHFAMRELLNLEDSFWTEGSLSLLDGFDQITLEFVLRMSIYRNDGFYKIIQNRRIEVNERREDQEIIRQEFSKTCARIRGIKNGTIDLANYDLENELNELWLSVFFMSTEQIKTLLRRVDLDHNKTILIYVGMLLNENNHQLFMELIRDEQIGNPDQDGIKKIFEGLASLGKADTIKYLLENLPINLRPNQEVIIDALIYASEKGKVNVIKYFLEEASEELRPNQEAINVAISVANTAGKVNVVKYFIEEAPEGLKFVPDNRELFELLRRSALTNNSTILRYLLEEAPVAFRLMPTQVKKRRVNSLLDEMGDWNDVSAAKYLMEEAPEDLRPDREVVFFICSQLINSKVSEYLFTKLTFHEKMRLYPDFQVACASSKVLVAKYYLEEIPVGLRPDREAILQMYAQYKNSELGNYLYSKLNWREIIPMYTRRKLRAIASVLRPL